jgi:hypothetical protein
MSLNFNGSEAPLSGFLLFAFPISAFQPAPARALAAEALTLERTLSDLVNQAYALTPAENALMWQSAPPRMLISPPAT